MKPSPETLLDRLGDIYPNKWGTVVTPRPSPLMIEAANEIVRLRAQLEKIRAASGLEFLVGDLVEKYTGDYKLSGIVAGHAVTVAGQVRYVVEHQPLAPGLLHIYGPNNLRRL